MCKGNFSKYFQSSLKRNEVPLHCVKPLSQHRGCEVQKKGFHSPAISFLSGQRWKFFIFISLPVGTIKFTGKSSLAICHQEHPDILKPCPFFWFLIQNSSDNREPSTRPPCLKKIQRNTCTKREAGVEWVDLVYTRIFIQFKT